MHTLSDFLEDGTMLFDRYVKQNPYYQHDIFMVDKETDIYQFVDNNQLMTVEILQPNSRLRILHDTIVLHGSDFYAYVVARMGGIAKLSNILAPKETFHTHQTLPLGRLGNFFRSVGHPVTLRAGHEIYSNIVDAQTVNRGVAQIVVVNKSGAKVLWASAKKSGPFQRYIDVSERTEHIFQHKEMQSFVDRVAGIAAISDGKISATFWRPMKDGQLAAMALFGPDFGGKDGPNNVQIMGHGDAVLRSEDGEVYELDFQSNTWVAPNLYNLTGSYEPVLAAFAKKGARRGFRYKGRVYEVELAICPYREIKQGNSQEV